MRSSPPLTRNDFGNWVDNSDWWICQEELDRFFDLGNAKKIQFHAYKKSAPNRVCFSRMCNVDESAFIDGVRVDFVSDTWTIIHDLLQEGRWYIEVEIIE